MPSVHQTWRHRAHVQRCKMTTLADRCCSRTGCGTWEYVYEMLWIPWKRSDRHACLRIYIKKRMNRKSYQFGLDFWSVKLIQRCLELCELQSQLNHRLEKLDSLELINFVGASWWDTWCGAQACGQCNAWGVKLGTEITFTVRVWGRKFAARQATLNATNALHEGRNCIS